MRYLKLVARFHLFRLIHPRGRFEDSHSVVLRMHTQPVRSSQPSRFNFRFAPLIAFKTQNAHSFGRSNLSIEPYIISISLCVTHSSNAWENFRSLVFSSCADKHNILFIHHFLIAIFPVIDRLVGICSYYIVSYLSFLLIVYT